VTDMTNRRLLNSRDVRRFLAAKGARGQCSACANHDFDILDEELIGGRVGYPVLQRNGNEAVSAGLFEVVVLACTNCGNLCTYERKIVADWVASNPAKKISVGAGAS